MRGRLAPACSSGRYHSTGGVHTIHPLVKNCLFAVRLLACIIQITAMAFLLPVLLLQLLTLRGALSLSTAQESEFQARIAPLQCTVTHVRKGLSRDTAARRVRSRWPPQRPPHTDRPDRCSRP